MTDPLALSGLTMSQAELTGDRPITPDSTVEHLRDRMETYRTLAEERDDTIAQLRAELAAISAQRDELLTMVDEKNSEIARLNCEVAVLWQRIDNGNESEEAKDSIITELRSQIEICKSETVRLRSEVVSALNEKVELINGELFEKNELIEQLRSQIDQLTTAALTEPTQPQPQVDVEALMNMINTQHQIIARLDQHLAVALGMADYKKMLGQ